MVHFGPFRGVRYADAAGLAALTAPPYDAIDPALSRRLHARSPHNVVRLERAEPRPGDPRGDDRYARAAVTYAAWTAEGVLRRDPEPALYLYEQRYRHAGRSGTQRGVLAALRLVPWTAGEVLPHERVFRGPVEDRLRLLTALPVNTSPVYVLARGEPAAVVDLFREVSRGPPAAAFTDAEDQVEHRLWVVAASAAVGAVTATFEGVQVVMADGHHRYSTALEHHAARPSAGSDRILAYVVGVGGADGSLRGPVVRPMHRLVRRLPGDADERLRAVGVDVQPVQGGVAAIVEALRGVPSTIFGCVSRRGAAMLAVDPLVAAELVADSVHPEVADLDVAVVQAVLSGVLGVADDPGALVYTPDVAQAAEEVGAGRADALFVLRPPSLERVLSSAAAGALMPPKSTSFFPKPRTGLVLRPLQG
ncbi:MAG TPA: DUF1015 domain-containing protein [Nitriliruptorales bacterium]|nr:DUF1015 domain-containing protein [Nitriliruptorales bacterium]